MRITCYTTQKPRVLIAKSSTSGKIDNDTMHNRAIHQGQVNNFCEEPQETEESVWDQTRVITAEKCRHELIAWIAIPYGGHQSPLGGGVTLVTLTHGMARQWQDAGRSPGRSFV